MLSTEAEAKATEAAAGASVAEGDMAAQEERMVVYLVAVAMTVECSVVGMVVPLAPSVPPASTQRATR